MVVVYDDYDDEPEDVFLPLSTERSSEFYDIEMQEYREDVLFYRKHLPSSGTILELGCGSGRITTQIHSSTCTVVGVDISTTRLTKAVQYNVRNAHFFCMDMAMLAFSIQFDAIVIGYNSLNLLVESNKIRACLESCRTYLKPGGKLFVQLYTPTNDFCTKSSKTFQFQVFDPPQGGKLIKEVLRLYQPSNQTVEVEERYRVRPMHPEKENEDLSEAYLLAGFSAQRWLALFAESGFTPLHLAGGFNSERFEDGLDSRLVAVFY